ncbi:hypothetical protein NMG60_11018684, partial [Bertholletia excelsa]
MEDLSTLGWGDYYQEEKIEELKHCLLYKALELETTILSAHEEIARKEKELAHFNYLLAQTIRERDEARAKYQILMLENSVFEQGQIRQFELSPFSWTTTTSNKDDTREGGSINGISSFGTNENVDVETGTCPGIPLSPQPTESSGLKKPLPENGKFLQAVTEAGPLLQTLLLAGPLPRWQNPPPQLNPVDIPPVTVPWARSKSILSTVEKMNECILGDCDGGGGPVTSQSSKW